MLKPMLLTANDTYPTALGMSTTDPVTKVAVPTPLDGFTIALEIDYSPAPPLVKTATILGVGQCEFRWVTGDLVEGEWKAKLTITNAENQKISSEFLDLVIDKDITPPAP